eukprot:m.28764 g.28764  ORF g.28764 m.28764 type:complete len:366 (+) comp10329_c0_seq1:45-1142(+)
MSGAEDPNPDLSQEELDRLEQEHCDKIIASFLFYEQHATERLDRARDSFQALSPHHQRMVPSFAKQMDDLQEAVRVNAEFIANMLADKPLAPDCPALHRRPSEFDMDKVYTTIKQLVRDWATEGKAERDSCYQPLLHEADRLFANVADKGQLSVCVPGVGLGRLCFEFARRGYRTQGNEWSMHMLYASSFLLNRCPGVHHTKVYPWAHIFTNHYTSASQTRAVMIPDVDPYSLPEGSDFSMAAGDFLEIYSDPAEWDCVATCFFLDTARNVISYIENIFNMLKPGGYWINFGPLLYHFDDNRGAPSIELSFEQIREVVKAAGFIIVQEKFPVRSGYIGDAESMLDMQYRCVFMTAQKPPVQGPHA